MHFQLHLGCAAALKVRPHAGLEPDSWQHTAEWPSRGEFKTDEPDLGERALQKQRRLKSKRLKGP